MISVPMRSFSGQPFDFGNTALRPVSRLLTVRSQGPTTIFQCLYWTYGRSEEDVSPFSGSSDLADVDCRLATEGPSAFYKGTVAPLIGIGACVSLQFAFLNGKSSFSA